MKKRAIAYIALAALLMELLGGCADPGEDKSAVSAVGEDGPLTPYAEPLTLSMMFETNAGTQYLHGDTIENNVITRFFEEKLNVRFDLSWQVDAGNYAEQLDLAIASNTGLPDMFIATKGQLYTLAASGQILDLAPYYEKYASENLKKVLGFNDNEGLESATLLGGTYALPLTNDVGDGASLVFIRQDWLDALGLETPQTLGELIEVARAFVDNDMSGRGNTIGISMANDLGFTFDVFANAYGAWPDLWLDDGSGRLVYGSVQPEVKDALQSLQGLYQEGLIHKEFAAQDTTRLAQYVAQGRLGIFIGPFWYNNNYILSNLNADPEAQWTVVNNLSLNEGDTVSSRAWNTTYRWLAVNANCGNPEAAVKLMNLWYEIWQGEYSDWFWDLQMSDDYYEIDMKEYSPIFFDPPLKNVELGVKLRAAYESGDTSSLNAEGLYAYSQMTTDIGSAINRSAMLTWYGSFDLLEKTYASFQYDQYRGPEDTVFSAMVTTLDELENKAFIDIIMGADVNTFDTFVEQWYQSGGQTVSDQVNEWYAQSRQQ